MYLLIGITVFIIFCIHKLLWGTYGYWETRGVPFPKPTALMGNLTPILMMKKMFGEHFADIYRDFEGYRYVGVYKAKIPALLLRDPELIKDVLVKNFNSFHDNDSHVDEKLDPLVAKNPFFLNGHKWKVVRSQVTAAITTGKIKSMFNLMTTVGVSLKKYLENNQDASSDVGLETKELAAKYTTDVVALCAFGLDGKSFIEEDAEFRRMGRKFLQPSGWVAIKHILMLFFPSWVSLLRLKFVPADVEEWFIAILSKTMKYRKENNVVRNDYLDLMMSLKDKPGEYEFTDLDVMAQAMTFYGDGFETSSIALSFTLYEIAKHLAVQKKLQDEVDQVLSRHKGEITYEAIQEMAYLEKVLWEGLRKYPAGAALTKKCTQATTFPPPKDGGKPLEIKEGMNVILPILALHYDPKYYPDPQKFDPERHSEEGKASRPKYTFLPFGEGPRQCLGFRFALAQIKAAIVSIVRDFDIKVNAKTQEPLEWDPAYFMPAAKGGLWLNYYKRK